MLKKYFSLASIFILLLFFSCKATVDSQSSQSEENIAIESISVSTSSGETNLSVGETLQLIVEVSPQNASNKSVSFVSRKPSYALVSESGLVTAKKAGTVIIDVFSSANNAISSSIKLTLVDSSSQESSSESSSESSEESENQQNKNDENSSESSEEPTLSDPSVIMAILSDFDVISSEALDSSSVSDSSSVNAWTSSMTLSISDSSSVYSYKPNDIFSSEKASFTFSGTSSNEAFEISDGTKYYAFSPERALISFSDSVVSSRVYAKQDFSLNNSEQSYVAASATSQGNDIDFSLEPILSVIEIDLSDFTKEAQSVSIKSNSGVSIAGSFTYDIDSKTLTVNSSDSTTYSASLQSDVVSVSNVSGETLVKAYILPVKLVGGLTITVRDTDGNFYTKTTSSDIGNSSSEISLSGIVSSGAYVSSPTVTTCLPYSKRIAFGSEEVSSVRKNNWQSVIPSNTWFSMLSTPGAHDSATSTCTDYTAYSKCQMLSISELLEAGVRAFDLRPGYMYKSEPTIDTLGIFHGQCSTSILYKDAIATLVQFVIDNPTESITILQVKENSKPTITLSSYTDYSDTMWSIISEVLSQYSTYIINCDHSNFTLADLRGKIMMFNRNGTDCPPMIMLKNWPDNDSVTDYSVYTAGSAGGRMCASVEDCYNQTDTDEKLEVVKTLLNLASSNTNSKYYHFTFNSIASTGITIKISTYVGTMNWNTSQYILNELSGASGYVYGDYIGYSEKSGAVILNAIINQNFKYVYTSRSE